jgi:polysaccharide deacetylase family protein (PEP-CTERM system associated)
MAAVTAPANVLSVDVEDYFQVEAFSGIVDRAGWDRYPSRVEANTRRLLDLFDELEVKATCFVLGWVAHKFPALVREIAARGHELACHSYWHRLVYTLTPGEFREDTALAKTVIEQAAGQAIEGYRAPSYSVTSRALWALEVLAECGFRYDSSIFPIRHDIYGIPHAPRHPFRLETPAGPLIEYPISTFRLGRLNLPVGGGGYLRIFPFWYTRLGFLRVQAEGLPLIVYTHPWEVDPGQPRLAAGARSRFRHYTNLERTYGRLLELIRSGSFGPFAASALAGCAVDLPLDRLASAEPAQAV